jgi:peptidoglycan/LPS O-acetylase OafA/YrhL
MDEPTRLGYRPALDGVRAIAIAIVVAFHAFGWPSGGTLGVDLFFVLSGFLITTLLLEEYAVTGAISIRGFYGRRARRLLPALFVMLAPFLLLAGVMAAVTASFHSPLLLGLGGALTYTSNIIVATDPSAVPASLVHLWSLAAEEQFYIVWPLLLLLLLRLGGGRLVVRALGVLLAFAILYRFQLVVRGASIDRLYYAPDTHADSLLIGCIFGCFFVRGRPRLIFSSELARKVSLALTFILIFATVVLIDSVPARLAYATQLLPTGFAAAAGVFVVCAALGGSAVARALSVRPLVFLGRISYALYLWHLPLLVAFAGAHRDVGLRTGAAVAAAIAVAVASRYFVELPLLSRRRDRNVENPQAAGAAAPALALAPASSTR